MAAEGKLNVGVVILLGAIACIIADLIWYQAGRLRGDAVLHFAGRFSFGSESSTARIGNTFSRYDTKTLLVSKFVIGLDALAPPLAGIFGMNLLRFLSFDAVGATCWAAAYCGVGFIFWKQLSTVTTHVEHMGGLLSSLVLFLLVVIIARRVLVWYRLFQELRLARITPVELKQAMDSGESLQRNPGLPIALRPIPRFRLGDCRQRGSPTLTEMACTSVPPQVMPIRRGPRQSAALR